MSFVRYLHSGGRVNDSTKPPTLRRRGRWKWNKACRDQAHQTLHRLLFCRDCAWNSERKSDQTQKGRNSCPTDRCLTLELPPDYHTKTYFKTLKESMTDGKDLEWWHQDERHWVLLAWVRTRMKGNCKATFVHNKWRDGSGMTANSCLVSSELTAATSAGLSLPLAPLPSSLTELMSKALQCGREGFAGGKGLWMLLEQEGKVPSRSKIKIENAQSKLVTGYG